MNMQIEIHRTVILPVILYGCETWSFTLRDELRLRVLKDKLQRKICGSEKEEVTGDWREMHNEELYELYSTPYIIRGIKLWE
jgi:hypothetical protein